MLHRLIAEQAAAWFCRDSCPVKSLVTYIQSKGAMRDPQIEAIKTYLYLKIEGANRPLKDLLCEGSLVPHEDLSQLHLSEAVRAHFQDNPAARTLYEFARLKTPGSAAVPALETYLRDHAADIACDDLVERIFLQCGVSRLSVQPADGSRQNLSDGSVYPA